MLIRPEILIQQCQLLACLIGVPNRSLDSIRQARPEMPTSPLKRLYRVALNVESLY